MTQVILPTLMLTILAWLTISDLLARRIPNAASMSLVALWMTYAIFTDKMMLNLFDVLMPLAVFGVGVLAWRLGLLGGGDVKLIGALGLWAGDELLAPFLVVTALLGGGLAVASMAVRRAGLLLPARLAVGLSWAGLPVLPGDQRGLPYGVAIGLAGAWLVNRLFWH